MKQSTGRLWSMLTLVSLLGTNACLAQPETARRRMVAEQLEGRDIHDPRVLKAMATVPRHLFVPPALRHQAYQDHPLPIGEGQTISQPYIVALMTQLADVQEGDRVLEVGTGSGYQAAVLAEMGARVFTVEIVESLANAARATLEQLGCDTVQVRHGDGYAGWPDEAPFDAILVTAAPERIPQPLLEQLADGGHLVIPVGPQGRVQTLLRVTRRGRRFQRQRITPVRFVPMTGEVKRPPQR